MLNDWLIRVCENLSFRCRLHENLISFSRSLSVMCRDQFVSCFGLARQAATWNCGLAVDFHPGFSSDVLRSSPF